MVHVSLTVSIIGGCTSVITVVEEEKEKNVNFPMCMQYSLGLHLDLCGGRAQINFNLFYPLINLVDNKKLNIFLVKIVPGNLLKC